MSREYTYDEEVTLISVTSKESPAGDRVLTESRRVSYATITSPYMRETYQAMAQGLKPEFVAVLPNWEDDYHGEGLLEYEGQRYKIIRAYRAKDDSCELTVTRAGASAPKTGALASGVSGGDNNADA